MSKKSTINEKHPVLNEEPVVSPPIDMVIHGANDLPPVPEGVFPAPQPVAAGAFADFTHLPGVEAEVWDTRIVKSGIRLSSPKVLLHVPAVFE